jgi:hypoxanthine-DNA glycosylase
VGPTNGFQPIVGPVASTLILGTLPSQQSLLKHQYYGHPRNAFWPIMGELFGAGLDLAYTERAELLTSKGVAVWDVLRCGSRPGSMDAAIDEATAIPNDFASLYAEHPELRLICFNGQAANRLFRKLVSPDIQSSLSAVKFVTMPSTSPAYAAMGFAEKLERWTLVSN